LGDLGGVSRKGREKGIDRENDPLVRAAGIFESEEADLSVNHDHYFYGAPKKKIIKK